MTAASYSIPELTTMNTGEATTNWAEPGTWTAGGLPVAETDYFIQGTGCIDKTFNATGLGGLMYNSGADQALTSTEVFLAWVYFAAPNALDTYANGGLRLMVGSLNTAFKAWALLGSDTYAYGGWRCVPVDPAIAAEYTVGSPSAGVHQYFGMAVNVVNAVAKGNPCAIDCIRYGRGTLQTINGEAAAYGTFAGAAGEDQNVTNRWGLCQLIDGTFVMQGHFLMGTAATAVDFRDSNRNLVIANTLKVQSTFNLFEIRNASSRVDWTNISITALGTVSKGDFTVTDNADVNIESCTFAGMGVFTLLGATGILNSTFRSCGPITAPGSTLTGTSVLTPVITADTSAVVWNVATDPDGFLDDMTFSKGTTAHHAIELGTSSPTTVTLRGITFSGFNAANAQNDSAIHVKRTTGDVTINAVGCSGTVSYKSAGANVTVVADPVTATITVKDVTDSANIENARVLVLAGATGPLPSDDTVTITRSGATATVAHTAHGMTSSTKIQIKGATQPEYNGVFTITVTNANEYTYTVSGTPATPATGTIKATAVIIDGLTNASGVVSDTRTYASDQAITGRVRKSTTGTLYKTGSISGTISSTAGFAATVQLIRDT